MTERTRRRQANARPSRNRTATRPRITAGRAQGVDCDLLITNATVITMDAERRVLATGAVALTGRRITAVGPERSVLGAYRARRRIDVGGGLVHPGLIDPHVHIVHGTCRGIFGDALGNARRKVNFADWKADVRPREEHAAAVFAGLEMLHNGFTCYVEPGTVFDCDAVAAATEQVGLRGLLAGTYVWDQIEIMKQLGPLDSRTLYRRARAKLERSLDEMGSQLHRNADPDALVRGFVMIYGTGTASDELERAAFALAKSAGAPFHQHESYLPSAYGFDKERLGRSRLVHLHELGVLDGNSTLVHMNVIEDDDVPAILDSGVNLIWCPFSYLHFGMSDRIPCRLPEMLRRGANVALAIDITTDASVGSSAAAAFLAAGNARAPLAPEDILEMQTVRAARTAGLDREIGSLEPGKRADIVIRSPLAAEAQPAVNPVHQLALLNRAGGVDTVIVDGRIVLRGGRSTRVDEGEAYALVKSPVEQRMRRLGLSPSLAWPVIR
jgi:5-methylthioadenosine/S-adenosylhomocysteine deaminase